MAESRDRPQHVDATGQLIERQSKRGTTWGARLTLPVSIYGEGDDGRPQRPYETLGRTWEGCDRREAGLRLKLLVAQVRTGQYRTRAQRDEERRAAEAARGSVAPFAAFSEEWLAQRIALGGRSGDGLSRKGTEDLRWRLDHLKAWFGDVALDGIEPTEVEAYALAKRTADVGEGGLGANSTNKTLATLETILQRAVRLRVIDRNPVDGYRVPTGGTKRRPYIDGADHLAALLDAAGAVDDARAKRGLRWRRAFLAMLALGGPRIAEAMAVRRGDVDLGRGRLRVRGTKTDAADRWVPLVPLLADELATYIAAIPDRAPAELLFATSSGGPVGASNVRRRVLAPTVERADGALTKTGGESLPPLTPHALRRTAASIWFAIGWDLPTVMGALGHTSERMTLGVYAKAMKLDDDDRERLRAMVLGETLDDLDAAASTIAAGPSINDRALGRV